MVINFFGDKKTFAVVILYVLKKGLDYSLSDSCQQPVDHKISIDKDYFENHRIHWINLKLFKKQTEKHRKTER